MSGKRYLLVCGLVALALGGCVTVEEMAKAPEPLCLASFGESPYHIVIADDASPSTRYAAEELQRFLGEIAGAELPIVSERAETGPCEIVLGDSAHLRALNEEIDFDALGDEGYVIRTVGNHLVIAGGALRGNLYGVYGLLEDHLGCKWFTPEVSRIPEQKHLLLGPLDETQVPVLEYREPFVIDCFDGDWCARNRVNSSAASLEERHGGKVRFGAGMFVHTFNGLIPPDKYFAEHPEYFSEIDGKRVQERTQLCCTNEDVVRICTEEMRKRIEADPGAFVYSLSQNDWGNYCECPKCQALAEAEGSQMAPVLQLVNRVAEAIEKDYPDKAIETLAYQWTRKAPKTMRPRPNVIIRLCSIECCFMHPLGTCDGEMNTAFREDAAAWAKVADRLWVWDYVTSFRHFLCPFPNLRVLDDNIRFYIDHNVRGIFEQDNYRSLSGELSPLGGYMIAKFLWDPAYGEDRAMDEFLEGVYGDAAKYIRKYIDLLHDKVAEENLHANIWIGPVEAPYLTPEIMAKADTLWDKAQAAVVDDPEVLERVKIARLSLEYAWVQLNRNSAYILDHERFRAVPDPAFAARISRFFNTARRANVTWIDEWRETLDAYEKGFEGLFDEGGMVFEPQAPAGPAQAAAGIAYGYYESEGEWKNLPDFGALQAVEEGVAERMSIAGRKQDDKFGFRFHGFIHAPRNGLYRFYTNSNDGSRLVIGGQVLVDNDGQHSNIEKSGMVGLKAGLHPIEVTYFESGGSQGLAVLWEGPGIDKQMIPAEVLFHAAP